MGTQGRPRAANNVEQAGLVESRLEGVASPLDGELAQEKIEAIAQAQAEGTMRRWARRTSSPWSRTSP
ncbi:hypothetical protein Aau02nite_45090 [Amorphoplanes auranticolor]|uniref:Uncharacterized protein n=1 Tax=Actinoplanes auranticolor TaxID=47988 RepID=A0A919SG65_9ACTN|nr:hypothetical protein Aau02nite_45090 [Actinoplanes auranticolor]